MLHICKVFIMQSNHSNSNFKGMKFFLELKGFWSKEGLKYGDSNEWNSKYR